MNVLLIYKFKTLSIISPMASSDQEIASELLPLLRVYKNGRVERLIESQIVPPSLKDATTGVSSKDITISTNPSISARIYIPSSKLTTTEKLPLLVYFHGGGFCIESAFSLFQQRYLNAVVSQANVVAVSVDYRLAPEHPLPVAYEDCWTSLQWVLSHTKHHHDEQPQPHSITHGFDVEPWLKNNVNFERVFLGGDSAGANIAHNIAVRAGANGLSVIRGMFLVHPYFWGSERIGSEADMDEGAKDMVERIWLFVNPCAKDGLDDPMFNPFAHGAPSLSGLGCKRVLVCVAENDVLKERGKFYCEELKKNGWEGEDVELFESAEEGHAFHVFSPDTQNAQLLFKCLASFLNK